MANRSVKGLFLVGSTMILSVTGWAQRSQGRGMQGMGSAGMCQTLLDSLPKQDVSATEATGLTYLREEEKLARDVYTKLYAKWGSTIFGSIAQSEQRHFDAPKVLLDRYGMADPAADKSVGVFSDSSLQALYGILMAKVQVSLAAALRVGAEIEDIDIRDLSTALTATENDDFKLVYHNLQRGSRNHMRAFAGQLDALGESCAAQYISAEELAQILASPHEAGMGNVGSGNGPMGRGYGNGTCPWGNTPTPNPGTEPQRPW